MTTPANPTPAALAALDELERLATQARDTMAYAACRWLDGLPAGTVDHEANSIASKAQGAFIAACSPDVILALLAAARQGEEDTARLDWMQSRCAQLSVPDYPRVWDVTPDGGAYHFTPLTGAGPTDLREALDAARAASQPEEVSRG